MYLDYSTVKTSSGKKHTRILLRESYRENGKVKKRTLANMTNLPKNILATIKTMLNKGNENATLANLENVGVLTGVKFGALYVLFTIIQRLGILEALGLCREAMLVVWLICARILFQGSRLKAVRMSKQYAIKTVLGIDSVNKQGLYDALDWLHKRQTEIENKLHKGRVEEVFLYDVTSCYFEGQHNELADYGYNRDGKKGKKQIVIGLLTDVEGEPLSIEVFKGNTADPKTCSKKIEDIKTKYSAASVTIIGDRGMIKGPQIDETTKAGFNYITSITKPQLEKLLKEDVIQLSLFDEDVNEVIYGDVRYVVRHNRKRAEELAKNRKEKLEKVIAKAKERNIYLKEHRRAKEKVACKCVLDLAKKLKIDNWINITINERVISVQVCEDKLQEISVLDGCYAIKTSLIDPKKVTAKQIHERYKDLALVEWAFRSIKTTILENRPIYHRLEERTKAVCFISMLAYKIIRYIVRELANKEVLQKIEAKEKNPSLVDEIVNELDMIQEATLTYEKLVIPIILTPSPVANDILSVLNIQLPKPKKAA